MTEQQIAELSEEQKNALSGAESGGDGNGDGDGDGNNTVTSTIKPDSGKYKHNISLGNEVKVTRRQLPLIITSIITSRLLSRFDAVCLWSHIASSAIAMFSTRALRENHENFSLFICTM